MRGVRSQRIMWLDIGPYRFIPTGPLREVTPEGEEYVVNPGLRRNIEFKLQQWIREAAHARLSNGAIKDLLEKYTVDEVIIPIVSNI